MTIHAGRRGLSWAVVALSGLVLAAPSSAETPCTYYAAPVEKDGGKVPAGEPFAARHDVGTPDRPIPIADFWERKLVKPGTVLCLKNGVYRGAASMIKPPREQFPGAPGARIEIRALNDGGAWIDGGFKHAPLRLRGHDYWTVSGLNLYNSRGPVVGVAGLKQKGDEDQVPTHHVVLRRLVAWRDYLPFGSEEDYAAIGGQNVHIYSLTDVSDILVEDCAGFGWARKIFQNFRSKRVVLRRNWARWDGRHPYRGGNKFSFSCAYRGYDALCENLIATVGGSRDPAAQPSGYAPGIHLIATDGAADADARWLEPPDRDVFAINLRIYGSLAYSPRDPVFEIVTGYHIGGSVYPSKGLKGVLIEDSAAGMAGPAKYAAGLSNCDDDPVEHPDGCSWDLKDDRAKAPVQLRRVTLASAKQPAAKIHADWRREDVRVVKWGKSPPDIYRGPKGGASLCYRYVDGRETSLPLWPWPMQDRIRVATEHSKWPTADVMAEIIDLFGAPPAECTTS
jgi:hypothetical protein